MVRQKQELRPLCLRAVHTLRYKMNRKKGHFMCTGNQEQRSSQINCQAGRWAEGLSRREGRKQDNRRLVLEIIPELCVPSSGRISVTHRARLKWKEMVQRRKRMPLPWNVSVGVKTFPSNLSGLPLLQSSLWIITSRPLAGMELRHHLWPPQEAAETWGNIPSCDPESLLLRTRGAIVFSFFWEQTTK